MMTSAENTEGFRTLKATPPRHVVKCKWENYIYFLHPDGDLDLCWTNTHFPIFLGRSNKKYLHFSSDKISRQEQRNHHENKTLLGGGTREFKIPVHVMTCTPKLQVQVYVPVEGLFS